MEQKFDESFSINMKSSTIHTIDKRVNKSLQDRLRRDRISKSVEQLRELVLGPSIEHAKIGKADILKLTVQYIRNLRQKELMETSAGNQKSMETSCCNREAEIKTPVSNFTMKQQVCSTEGRIQTTGTDGHETEAGSENSMAFCNKNVYSDKKLSPTQLQKCLTRSVVFGNTSSVLRARNGVYKRAPFCELNSNSKQIKNIQTIWRPWGPN